MIDIPMRICGNRHTASVCPACIAIREAATALDEVARLRAEVERLRGALEELYDAAWKGNSFAASVDFRMKIADMASRALGREREPLSDGSPDASVRYCPECGGQRIPLLGTAMHAGVVCTCEGKP